MSTKRAFILKLGARAWPIIGPVSATIMHVSKAVRQLQHGSLQFYILYVVAGLIALGVLVMLGGAQ